MLLMSPRMTLVLLSDFRIAVSGMAQAAPNTGYVAQPPQPPASLAPRASGRARPSQPRKGRPPLCGRRPSRAARSQRRRSRRRTHSPRGARGSQNHRTTNPLRNTSQGHAPEAGRTDLEMQMIPTLSPTRCPLCRSRGCLHCPQSDGASRRPGSQGPAAGPGGPSGLEAPRPSRGRPWRRPSGRRRPACELTAAKTLSGTACPTVCPQSRPCSKARPRRW
mmetsp:Transcript_54716/g.145913  ORF Transcript_54716/g.145913 Transcript_54716/m.145913 type:complete len:220 (+) Transcript_54716:489-1148(+)